MGQTGSNMMHKVVSPLMAWSNMMNFKRSNSNDGQDASSVYGPTPFVFTRRGSQYFDEDGDVAHEFYEEVVHTHKDGRKTSTMKKCKKLKPQGIVDLSHPRLHTDLPVVLCETPPAVTYKNCRT